MTKWVVLAEQRTNNLPANYCDYFDRVRWFGTNQDFRETVIKNYVNNNDAPHVKSFEIEEKRHNENITSRVLVIHASDEKSIDILTMELSKTRLDSFNEEDKKKLEKTFDCSKRDTLIFLLSVLNKLTPFSKDMQRDIISYFFKNTESKSANEFRSKAFEVLTLGDLCYAAIRENYNKVYSSATLTQLPTDITEKRPGLNK